MIRLNAQKRNKLLKILYAFQECLSEVEMDDKEWENSFEKRLCDKVNEVIELVNEKGV